MVNVNDQLQLFPLFFQACRRVSPEGAEEGPVEIYEGEEARNSTDITESASLTLACDQRMADYQSEGGDGGAISDFYDDGASTPPIVKQLACTSMVNKNYKN